MIVPIYLIAVLQILHRASTRFSSVVAVTLVDSKYLIQKKRWFSVNTEFY